MHLESHVGMKATVALVFSEFKYDVHAFGIKLDLDLILPSILDVELNSRFEFRF